MILVNQESGCVVNFNAVSVLYINSSGAVRTDGQGGSFRLADYGSYEIARIALNNMIRKIEQGKNVVYVPDKDEIERESRNQETVHKAANGKKTVRRGGS